MAFVTRLLTFSLNSCCISRCSSFWYILKIKGKTGWIEGTNGAEWKKREDHNKRCHWFDFLHREQSKNKQTNKQTKIKIKRLTKC